MPRARLTKRLVASIVPGPADIVIWDVELRRFGLKITPSGHKIYVIKYRHQGRQRKFTLGPADVMTPDQARTAAMDFLGEVAKNRDPASVKQFLLTEPTIADAFEKFITEHVETRRKFRTSTEYRRLYERHVKTRLAQRRLSDVSSLDIADLHSSLRGTPYQANRVVALMSKFFNYCESPNVRLREQRTNPCHKIERFSERSRERFLLPTELRALGEALQAAETNEWPWAIAAIRLLIFTGARRNEILQLRWEQVDLDQRRLSLPDSKTGAKVVVLSLPAVATLQHLATLRTAFPKSPWVVPSPRDAARPFVQLQSVWERVRAAADLKGLRLHDLRHSFASVAAARGTQQHLIMTMLGHANIGTTAKYMHYADDPIRTAVDDVAGEIAIQMQEGTAKIVSTTP